MASGVAKNVSSLLSDSVDLQIFNYLAVGSVNFIKGAIAIFPSLRIFFSLFSFNLII